MPTTTASPAEIWTEAREAAFAAAKAKNADMGPENKRGFDCGMAWITITPARGPFVSYLKSQKIANAGSYSGGPGCGIWYNHLHNEITQSVAVHEAAANAATEVLKRHGINASWSSRLD